MMHLSSLISAALMNNAYTHDYPISLTELPKVGQSRNGVALFLKPHPREGWVDALPNRRDSPRPSDLSQIVQLDRLPARPVSAVKCTVA